MIEESMRCSDLFARLDDLFDLERFAEPRGWDFALCESEREMLLSRSGAQFRRTFNGLITPDDQLDAPVRRVYIAVFPSADLLDRIIAQEKSEPSGGAIVLTHHPVDMET